MKTSEKIRLFVEGGYPWYQGGLDIQGIVTMSDYPEAGDCRRIWSLFEIDTERDIKKKQILDVCCGTGFYAMKADELGAKRAVGFDRKAEAITAAKKFAAWKIMARSRFYLSDFHEWNWGIEYDTVFFLQTLYHLEKPELCLSLALDACRGLIVLIVKEDLPWPGKELEDKLLRRGFGQEARYPDPLAQGKVVVKARRKCR